ncbi:hypothetical protein EYR40_008897 [Pleurotus pulmonarius]|nr:hypothetical protein EYR36_009719 [Pleurotus pulmonarius]KAF4594098.1 hypothetical protein EYR40_008897 [Pleurotus pulmonarius]
MYILCGKSSDKAGSRVMVLALLVMMALATAQLAVDAVNIFQAFVDNNRFERVLFLSNPTLPIFAAKHAIFFTMIVVGDAINTYRCYVVWNKRILIVAPAIILSIGSAVCSYQTIWATQHLKSVSIAGEASWGTASFALSISANSYATCWIAYRLWENEKNFFGNGSRRNSLMPVVLIIIESGALNAAYLIAYIAVLQSGSHGLEILAEFSTPFVGVIFTLMIVRIKFRSKPKSYMDSTAPSSHIPLPVSIQVSQSRTRVADGVELDTFKGRKDSMFSTSQTA